MTDTTNNHQSPPPPGTITVAATPPSSSSVSPSLSLGFPIQHYSGSHPRDEVWSEDDTSVLINAWGERYVKLSRGNLRQNDWRDVADVVRSSTSSRVPKTDGQCKNRIDTVKKRYKAEKAKVVAGCGPSQWRFYDRMDSFIVPDSTPVPDGTGVAKEVPVGIPLPHYAPPRQHLNQNAVAGMHQHLFPMQVLQHQQVVRHRFPSPQQLQQQQQQVVRNEFPMPVLQHQHQQQQQQVRRNFPTPVSQYERVSFGDRSGSGGVRNNYAAGEQNYQHLHKQEFKRKREREREMAVVTLESDSDEEEKEREGWSNDSGDSLPPERSGSGSGTRARTGLSSGGVKKGNGKGKGKGKKVWGNSVRELTRAIMKFGEAYEATESAKLEHVVEMEKHRMKFAKDLELQRMKFFMKTQLELSEFDGGSRGGGSSRRMGGGDSGGGGVEGDYPHHENHHANSDSSD